jgi:CubicO group peptidase (beta-lactamase class C family)
LTAGYLAGVACRARRGGAVEESPRSPAVSDAGGAGGSGGPGGGVGGDGGGAGVLSVLGTGGIGGVGGDGIDGGPAGKSGFNGTPPGLNAPSLARPARLALDLFLNGGALLGLQSGYVAMYARDGQVVHAATAGYADIASRTPMQLDTQFRIASMTKPITAVAAMILVEEGLLGLDDPVARYIPAAADLRVATSQTALPDGTIPSVPLDEPLTVRDLLKFSSGIGGGGDASDLERLWAANNLYTGSGSLAQRVDRIFTAPLYEQPGTRWRYGWSADVLARVVEVASGEPFGDFVTGRILEPLGMTSTEFLTAESPRDRLATMYTQDSAGHLVAVDRLGGDSLDWTPGGSGLVSTAGDYMRFALMLWNRGTFQDTQILKPETVTLMTQPAVQSGVLVDSGIEGLGWGLGMAVVVDGDATATFDRTGDFWWSGTYGTTFFVSPTTGLVGIVLSQNQTVPYSPTRYVVYLAQALAFLGL